MSDLVIANLLVMILDAFMAAMEADARERNARRKASEKEAMGIKELGNDAFRNKDYQKAVDLYTEVRL